MTAYNVFVQYRLEVQTAPIMVNLAFNVPKISLKEPLVNNFQINMPIGPMLGSM
jgi:hypothetical protein